MVQWDKKNPKMFIRKKIGYGWTLNMANPWSWLFICIVFLVIAGSFYFTMS